MGAERNHADTGTGEDAVTLVLAGASAIHPVFFSFSPMPPYILSETPLPICRQAHDPGWQLVALLERAAGAGAWVLELPSACLTWTDRLAELLEMPPDGVLAYKDALDFYAPESRELMAAALHACMAHDAPFDEEVQIITAHGQRLWVRSLGEAIHDASGTIVRIQGVLQNLTEKRRAAQESQSLTMRLSSMLASTSEAFVTLDMEGRLTYVNHESEKLLSLPGADLLGKPIWQVLRDNGGDRVRSEIRQALSGRRPIEFESFYAAPVKWL
jgi:PAS domain-containing protein